MEWSRLRVRLNILSTRWLLALIFVVALSLRLYGIDWDEGYGFHPDERSIYMRADCMYRVLTEAPGYAGCVREHPNTEPGVPSPSVFLDADRSPLNPHWFPLGSILIYLIVAARLVLEPFMDLGSLLDMSYIGRSIMALADTGTVYMVYLLGKRIYGSRVGLLASALVAMAVVHIQLSHFYRPEPLLVFFLLLSFWFMLQMIERRRLRDSALLGLFVGLTLATKVSVLPLILPLAIAYGVRLFTTHEVRWAVPSAQEKKRVVLDALLGGAVAMAVFLFSTPYALLDLFQFTGDIWWQATNVASTAGKVPFTVQYIGTTPFLYELKQTAIWGLGLPLGIVAWSGLLFTIFYAGSKLMRSISISGPNLDDERRPPIGEVLLLAWVVPNVVMLSLLEVKFLRYIFPVIPFLILMGSAMFFWTLDRARRATVVRYAPHAVIGIIAFVVAATAFYAVSFEGVYSRPHPAIQASRWINENVPPNSTIITDNHWDEGIPDIHRYRVRQIPIYEPDTKGKMGIIAEHLSQGDYLVFYSNRTYGSVARLPERYPLSSRYYRLLFLGELGYKPEKAFTSYPKLFNVAFVDDTFTRAGLPEPEIFRGSHNAGLSLDLGYADENVVDYDHPKVLLFRKVEDLSRSQLHDLLAEEVVSEPGLMLTAKQKATQRQGGTWSGIIQRDSWTNSAPILAWLLLVELIYLAALPLATFLFRPLPDRGIILARVLGILGVSYVAWLLASVGWVSFSRASVLAGIIAVATLSTIVLVTRWREFTEFLRKNWRLLAIGEVLFLVAFLSFVAIRMANPDLWHPFRGGEKPMDFAYLNAVLRSTSMPPYDPWFAGGYLNYYYWGQFIVATLIKGTGVLPSVAYNLAVPLMFALTLTCAYSLVYNMTAGIRSLGPGVGEPPSPSIGEGQDGGPSRIPLTPSHQGRENPGEASTHPPPIEDSHPLPPGRWRRWVRGVAWGPVAAGLLAGLFVVVIGNLDGLVQLVEGAWRGLFGDSPVPRFDFWRSSRMIPQLADVNPSLLTFWLPDKIHPNPDIGHHITEFPFFSFLFADLHAHLIVIPFTLLTIGLAFSLLVGLRTENRGWLVITTVALATAVGSLWTINSWDYPAYALLAVMLIGTGVYLMRGKLLTRLGIFVALASGMVLISILAFLPFHMNYHPFPTGLVVSKWQTPIHSYMGIHGLFVFLSATFLIYLSRRRLIGLLGLLVRRPSGLWAASASALVRVRAVPWTGIAIAVGIVVMVYLAAASYWTAAMLSLLLLLAVLALKDVLVDREQNAPYVSLPLMLIVFALLIGIGVEFVRAKDDIGRMNTLFKYYLEAWVLFGMASAYALWYLGSRGFFKLRRISLATGPWFAALALLIAASFIYPVLGTRARLADRFNTQTITLDGADYMRTAVHSEDGEAIELKWDYEAIGWLQDNVDGSPVVLEAHNEQYHWSSRIANYTGLPTVLGWPWHQIQQRMRYDYAVRERIGHVEEMYSTIDTGRALELLKLYEVEFVVVGQLERAYYPDQGLRKFDNMAQNGLAELVYQNEGVKIYQGLWYN